MKNLIYLFSFALLLLISCERNRIKFNNVELSKAIENYCFYLDSLKDLKASDYIYMESFDFKDSIIFKISLVGGSYYFLNEQERIIDFGFYNDYQILLLGDFPNAVVNNKKNKQFNVIDNIVKKRFNEDYIKYLNDKLSIAPLIYDYMTLTLTFKEGKLVRYSRQE
jgi:hypothetical protein